MNIIPDMVDRLLWSVPGAAWKAQGDDYDTLEWLDTVIPKPTADQLLAVKKPYVQARQEEYNRQGLTIDVLTVALWEQVVENKPQAMNDIQTKRLKIKQDIPKQ